ncbi:hypothetical protein GCM10011533_08560 [Streptosporangium jomthongense]|uniref:DUF6586 family protein n=1 Tax=Marinobacter aromaticivorans TaxID=1494078 RepID=A0ABW2ISK8_9GAMM|nr:DUF6586 family protein [Marinobacter aromaticivorans]GGE58317.1 hypothetical protein GCM10011533_08560 [Streptosporangium jomthongense]
MASQWYSLVSQKLSLARTLLDTSEQLTAAENPARAPVQTLQHEAAIQGSIELLIRARQLLFMMIATLHQKPQAGLLTLEQLARRVGDQAAEIEMLKSLQEDSGSWLCHLSQLEATQSRPPALRKTVSAENIIAISAEAGPDRSAQSLRTTLKAMKQFVDHLEDQHGEW